MLRQVETAKTSGLSPGMQAAQTIVAAMAHTYPELTGEEIGKLLRAGHGALEEFDEMPAYIAGQRHSAAVMGKPCFYNTEAMRGFIAEHAKSETAFAFEAIQALVAAGHLIPADDALSFTPSPAIDEHALKAGWEIAFDRVIAERAAEGQSNG